MATNKVIYGNTTLIDTSEDTAEVGDVKAGETFHSKTGAQMTGTMITSPQNMWYGTCPSYASAENKVVTTSSQDFDFQTGSMLRVSFEEGNTISSPYLVVDSGDPVLIEKLGLHQEVIATISRTVTSAYGQYYYFYIPSSALSPGSSFSVTIDLNSPYDSQDTYTDTVSYTAGQSGVDQIFVYQGSYLEVQYDGSTTISIRSTYSWSVAFSGNVKTGSGTAESLANYWKSGAVLDFVFDGDNFVLSDGGTNIPKNMWYGICPTSGSTTAKIVNTSTGDFVLKSGNMIRIRFDNATTSTLTSLAVDGTAATYVASVAGSADSSYRWNAGEVVDFIYDGTNYLMSEGGVASTTYYGVTKLSSSTSSTSTSLAATPSAVKSAYDLANSKSVVSITPSVLDGNKLADITINGTTSGIFMPYTPAGIIQMFAGSTAPTGWLLCDGSEALVEDYQELYDVIGDTYGTPSDSDHFVLPDFRGRSPLGAGLGTASDATLRDLGTEGGSERVTLNANQSGLRAHTHGFTQPSVTGTQGSVSITGGSHSHALSGNNKTVQSGTSYMRPKTYSTSESTVSGYTTSSTTHTHTLPAHTHTIANGAVGAVTGGAVGASESHGNMPPYLTVNYIISVGQ